MHIGLIHCGICHLAQSRSGAALQAADCSVENAVEMHDLRLEEFQLLGDLCSLLIILNVVADALRGNVTSHRASKVSVLPEFTPQKLILKRIHPCLQGGASFAILVIVVSFALIMVSSAIVLADGVGVFSAFKRGIGARVVVR